MGKSLDIDVTQLKEIVGANTATASIAISLFDLADKMTNPDEAKQLRAELDKLVTQAERIQSNVQTAINKNR